MYEIFIYFVEFVRKNYKILLIFFLKKISAGDYFIDENSPNKIPKQSENTSARSKPLHDLIKQCKHLFKEVPAKCKFGVEKAIKHYIIPCCSHHCT